ncbi:protein TIFY 10A [Quillaja saponaria]|uniref:Protein TIFY n=1 Tax=Quillaja saponaria TaxID=32244 RepID=A0AAD7L5Z4_QUISA|nr:protein TIFY 10A [Quillaja saponaria]
MCFKENSEEAALPLKDSFCHSLNQLFPWQHIPCEKGFQASLFWSQNSFQLKGLFLIYKPKLRRKKMSNLPVETRRSGKAPEKSNFSQACNLLSHYLKEKRSTRDISLGVSGKMETKATTMDLLTIMENPDDALRKNPAAMDFLPQFVENASIQQADSGSEPGTSQMTIFYAGKMLVFNNFSPDKATEIMELATKLSPNTSEVIKIEPNVPVAPQSKLITVTGTSTAQGASINASSAGGSEIRIARRNSLHKFFAKRKDRVTARGPYQMNDYPRRDSPKHEEGSSGPSGVHDLEDQSLKQFDLNL